MQNGRGRCFALRHSAVRFGCVSIIAASQVATVPGACAGQSCEYIVQTLHPAGQSVFLLGAGAFDGAGGAPTLVAVLEDGTILRLDFTSPGWTVQPLPVATEPIAFGSMGAHPDIDVRDVLPEFVGDEIVVKSDRNVNVLVQTAPGLWQTEMALDASVFLGHTWSFGVGDIDVLQSEQQDIFVATEGGALDFGQGHFAERNLKGEWNAQEVHYAEVTMDVAIGDTNLEMLGHEIILTTEMGPTYEITPQPDEFGFWPHRVLWDDFDNAGWTLEIADILPSLPGNEIAYGSRYSNSILLSRQTPQGHVMDVLFTGEAFDPKEPWNIWDIAVGDIDPSTPSLEIVGVDQLGHVYLVSHDGAQWSGQSIWQDADGAIHAVVVADFIAESPGAEIVVAGASGKLTLIMRCATIPGDIDGDGIVDESDRALLCAAMGSAHGEPGYISTGDLNSDEIINHLDLALFNAILAPCEGDIVTSATFQPPADGMTDAADLAYLLGAWGAQPSCADFVTSATFAPPPDGFVDGADLALLLGAWGRCD
jgi:hypothetical protein